MIHEIRIYNPNMERTKVIPAPEASHLYWKDILNEQKPMQLFRKQKRYRGEHTCKYCHDSFIAQNPRAFVCGKKSCNQAYEREKWHKRKLRMKDDKQSD